MLFSLTVVPINILNNRLRNCALHRVLVALPLQLTALISATPRIERALQRVALPPKHIVAVISMPSSKSVKVSLYTSNLT
jgi:hypothetical protein